MCDVEMSGLSVAESSIWMRVSISYLGWAGGNSSGHQSALVERDQLFCSCKCLFDSMA